MARGNRRVKKKTAEDLPGISLEKTVARIQQMMDANSTVTHDEMIEDRVGNKRQFDVVIRGQFGGRPVLGVIECKDRNRKTGPADVEAFANKSENVGANLRLIVSKKGFTQQALNLAKHEHIGCLSLMPADPKQAGFTIGCFWYGLIRKWTDVRLVVHFPADKPLTAGFRSEFVKWEGRPVVNWFIKELLTTYGNLTNEGERCFEIKFQEVRNLEIEGKDYPVRALSCLATRVFKKKKKWVSWSGDAFYDWHEGRFTVPAGGTLVGSGFEVDLSKWDDYEGEIPQLGQGDPKSFLTAVIYDEQKWDDTKDVPDLMKL